MSKRDAMKAAIYARVSTVDKDQNPETQLRMLREHCERLGWPIVRVGVDHASAVDMKGRTGWRDLLAARDYDAVLVTKLDRAWRSILAMKSDVGRLQRRGVAFMAITQPFDTGSSYGRLMMDMLAAFAEFERELLSERTREGMARARAEGKQIGRPRKRGVR